MAAPNRVLDRILFARAEEQIAGVPRGTRWGKLEAKGQAIRNARPAPARRRVRERCLGCGQPTAPRWSPPYCKRCWVRVAHGTSLDVPERVRREGKR